MNTKPDDFLDDIAALDPDLILVKPEPEKPAPKKRRRNVEWGGALIGLIVGVGGVLAGVTVMSWMRKPFWVRAAKVPAEMHIYQRGRHGVGLASDDAVLSTWSGRLKDWMMAGGLLDK